MLSLLLPQFVGRFGVSNLRFACFASQTPDLCSAIHSVPVKFVARLCL